MGQIFLFVPLPHSSLFLFLSPPPACRLQRGERPFVSGNCNFSVFDFGQRRKRGDIWYSKLFSFSRAEPVSGVPRSRETSDRADKVTGAKLGPSRASPLPSLDSSPFPRYQNFGKQQSTETWRHQLFSKRRATVSISHCIKLRRWGERRRRALPSNELRRALTSTENLSPQFQALFYRVRSLPSPRHFSLLLVGYKK